MKRITVLCGKYSGNSSDDWQSSDECTTEATSTHGFTHGQQHNYSPGPVPANIPCKLKNHIHKGKAGNHPGKMFTGILPKLRFFGRKWLNNMLGGAKLGLNELYVGITQQERNVISLPYNKGDKTTFLYSFHLSWLFIGLIFLIFGSLYFNLFELNVLIYRLKAILCLFLLFNYQYN